MNSGFGNKVVYGLMNISKVIFFLAVLTVQACTSNAFSSTWYNTNPDLIKFNVSEPDGKLLSEVRVTNLGSKSVLYVAPMGIPSYPAYYVEKIINGEIKTFTYNSGELSHDYTLNSGESLSFKFKNNESVIRVGLPIFNEHFEEYIVWFYVKKSMSEHT